MLDSLRIIGLAAVQGLAEFLPVSSSGHLALAESVFGLDSPGPALELFLHAGTLFSVCVFYRSRIVSLVRGVAKLERGALLYALCVAFSVVPAGLAYALAKDEIDAAFDSRRVVGALLLANGALLALSRVTDRMKPGGGPVTAARALAMSLGQALAILPGISRSGTSIHAGRLAGMSPRAAAEFSFLMSVPAILGAIALQILDDPGEALAGLGAGDAVAATVVSAAVGYAALRAVVKFWIFGVWCFAVGAAALAF